MLKLYYSPELELIKTSSTDVIRTSSQQEEETLVQTDNGKDQDIAWGWNG